MKRENIFYVMLTLALGFLLIGCATTKTYNFDKADPFNLENNGNTGLVRLGAVVEDKKPPFFKINGVDVYVQLPFEIVLPAGENEFEVMVKTISTKRGLIAMGKTIVVLGKIKLNIEAGKTYILRLDEIESISTLFLGMLVSADFKYVYYELPESLKDIKIIKEFPTISMDTDFWNTYKFPMME